MVNLPTVLALGMVYRAAAYPWVAPRENPIDASTSNTTTLDERGVAPLGGLGDLLAGLLGSLAGSVDPSDKRPDEAHPFQYPRPTDQRGPCPGLNALANHGYISRNGIVTAGEVQWATSHVFNMATDLSGLLVFIAVTFNGNLATETFSIGGEDDRTYSESDIGSKTLGRQYGLDLHSGCEGDGSAMREDFYLAHGDNHNARPERWRRFIDLAKKNGGQFNLAAANELYGQNIRLSIKNNPRFYYQGYTPIVILGEYPFLPAFFSNGTVGAGGVSNYESMASFLGFKIKDDKFVYVPERIPENWYRRSTPYGVVGGLIAGLVPTLLNGPIELNPLNILDNGGAANHIGCAIYQGITSAIPASVLGRTNEWLSAALTYAQNKLLPGIQPLYGCDIEIPPLQESKPNGGQYTDLSQQETRPGGGQNYGQIYG